MLLLMLFAVFLCQFQFSNWILRKYYVKFKVGMKIHSIYFANVQYWSYFEHACFVVCFLSFLFFILLAWPHNVSRKCHNGSADENNILLQTSPDSRLSPLKLCPSKNGLHSFLSAISYSPILFNNYLVDWLHWQLRHIDKNTGNGLVLSERECVVHTFSLSLTSSGVRETTCHPWKCHAHTHTHTLADVRGICEEMSTDHLLSPERLISEVFMNWRHSALVL